MSAARETPAFAWQWISFRDEAEAREYVAHAAPGVTPQGSGRFVSLCVLGGRDARVCFWTLHANRAEAKAYIADQRQRFGA